MANPFASPVDYNPFAPAGTGSAPASAASGVTPVDHNPFASGEGSFTSVEHDPFSEDTRRDRAAAFRAQHGDDVPLPTELNAPESNVRNLSDTMRDRGGDWGPLSNFLHTEGADDAAEIAGKNLGVFAHQVARDVPLLVGGAGAKVVDAAHGLLSGRDETGAQDYVFRNTVDPFQHNIDVLESTKPQARGVIGQTVDKTSGMAGPLALALAAPELEGVNAGLAVPELGMRAALRGMTDTAAANLPTAVTMAAPGAVEAGKAAAEKGGDAAAVGAATLGDLSKGAVQNILPMATGGTLATKLATGAGVNTALGAAGRAAAGQGTDATDVLSDAIIGAGMGAMHREGAGYQAPGEVVAARETPGKMPGADATTVANEAADQAGAPPPAPAAEPSGMPAADVVKLATQAVQEATARKLSPVERFHVDFLKKNMDNPEALAEALGVKLEGEDNGQDQSAGGKPAAGGNPDRGTQSSAAEPQPGVQPDVRDEGSTASGDAAQRGAGETAHVQPEDGELLDAPNFGMPEPAKALPDDHELLQSRDTDQSPERVAMRDRLVAQRFEGKAPAPEGQKPVAIVMGGGGASGKGTVLRALRVSGKLPEGAVELDPDSFKTGNPKAGHEGIPEYHPIVHAGDSRAAAVTHEESSAIYKQALARGIEGRFNLVLDRTMADSAKGLKDIEALKKAGYEVRMVGVTVHPGEAVKRAVQRASGPEKRYVPIKELLKAHKGFSNAVDHYAPHVDALDLYDNNVNRGELPHLIATGRDGAPLEIHDPERYTSFRGKGNLNEAATSHRQLEDSLGSPAGRSDPGAVAGSGEAARAGTAAVRAAEAGDHRGEREVAREPVALSTGALKAAGKAVGNLDKQKPALAQRAVAAHVTKAIAGKRMATADGEAVSLGKAAAEKLTAGADKPTLAVLRQLPDIIKAATRGDDGTLTAPVTINGEPHTVRITSKPGKGFTKDVSSIASIAVERQANQGEGNERAPAPGRAAAGAAVGTDAGSTEAAGPDRGTVGNGARETAGGLQSADRVTSEAQSTDKGAAVMQNRDRARAASIEQMSAITNAPDATRLSFSRDPNTGAPMVSAAAAHAAIPEADQGRADHVTMASGRKIPVRYAVVEAHDVEASHNADGTANADYAGAKLKALNNGRVAGLKAAYRKGEPGESYKQGLLDEAGLTGISPAAIKSKTNPVLIRLYDTEHNKGDMGAESNAEQSLGQSPMERAYSDARALPDLEGLPITEKGELSMGGDQPFYRAFLKSLGRNEAAKLVDDKGEPNKQFFDRLRAAVFAKAYGNERMLRAMAEDADPDARNVLHALVKAAPAWAKVERDGPLGDYSQRIAAAFDVMRAAREAGQSVDTYVRQGDLIPRDRSGDVWAQFFAEQARSANRMAEALRIAAEDVRKEQSHAGSADMFGGGKLSADQVTDRAIERVEARHGETRQQQSDLLAGGKDATARQGADQSRGDESERDAAGRTAPGRSDQSGSEGAKPGRELNALRDIPPDKSATITHLRRELAADPRIGNTLGALEHHGALHLIDDYTQNFAGRFDGRRLILNAAYLPRGEALGAALHEVVHRELADAGGLRAFVGPGEFDRLQRRLDVLKAEGGPAAELVAQAEALAAKSGETGARLDQERLTYFTQAARDAQTAGTLPAKAGLIYRQVVAAIRAAFYNSKFGTWLRTKGRGVKLTPDDFVALAEQAAQRQARAAVRAEGDSTGMTEQGAYARPRGYASDDMFGGSGNDRAPAAAAPKPSSGDLFGGATARDHVDAAQRAKDEQLRGAGTAVGMRQGDGELFAGARPEQSSIEKPFDAAPSAAALRGAIPQQITSPSIAQRAAAAIRSMLPKHPAAERELVRNDVRSALANRDRAIGTADAATHAFVKYFDKRGQDVLRDPLKAMESAIQFEKGQPVTDPHARPFFAAMRQMLDEQAALIRSFGHGYLEHLVTDYFPHLWQDPQGATTFMNSQLTRRPLGGNKKFTKERVFDTLEDGINAGMKPVTHNPAEMVMMRYQAGEKLLTQLRIMEALEQRGLVQQVANGQRIPKGWAHVNDPAFGNKLVPDFVARDLNNYLDPGLTRFAAWRGFRWLQNFLLTARLGLSAFHAGMTTLDTIATHADIGWRRALVLGDLAGGLKELGKIPTAIYRSPLEGGRLVKQFYGQMAADPHTAAILDMLAEGGARGYMSPTDFNDSFTKMVRAWRQGDAVGRITHTLPGLLEASTRLISHKLVPAQKMTARVMHAKFKLDELAESLGKQKGDYAGIVDALHPDAMREISYEINKTIDDRLGQFAYDNLFWNKTARDALHASVQSVGWNFGTARLLLGGAKDAITAGKNLATGGAEHYIAPLDKAGKLNNFEKAKLTDRLSYLVTLNAVVAMAGATLQFAMTGQAPNQTKDFFFPRTGRTNPDGSDERLSFPSYVKDEFALATHPFVTAQHKLHPIFNMAAELASNRDFYGTEIYNPDATLPSEVKDVLTYLGKSFLPYSVKGSQQSAGTGKSAIMQALPFIGITPAPGDIAKSSFNQYVSERFHEKHGVRTQAEAEHSKELADAISKLHDDPNADISNLDAKGQRFAHKAQNSQLTSYRFGKLNLEQQAHAYELATPAEREQFDLSRIIHKGFEKRLQALAPEDRQTVLDRIQSAEGEQGAR